MAAKGRAGKIAKLSQQFERRLAQRPKTSPDATAFARGSIAAFTENNAFGSDRLKQYAFTDLDRFEAAWNAPQNGPR